MSISFRNTTNFRKATKADEPRCWMLIQQAKAFETLTSSVVPRL